MPAASPDTVIRPLTAADRPAWEALWADYNRFYRAEIPPAVTDRTWHRLLDPTVPLHVLGAERGGSLVGFATYLFHLSTWSVGHYCYLEDLFTAAHARGGGIGRALITAVAAAGRQAGATRLYWATEGSNTQAQALYQTLAERTGFIQYRLMLTP